MQKTKSIKKSYKKMREMTEVKPVKEKKLYYVRFANEGYYFTDNLFNTKREAVFYAEDTNNGWDYKIIPVLITPIKKVGKKVKKK